MMSHDLAIRIPGRGISQLGLLFSLAALLFLLAAAPLSGQETGSDGDGDAAGIEAPTVIFEYESPEQRDIDALLPDEEALQLSEIEIPLPEAEELEAGSLSVPGVPPVAMVGPGAGAGAFYSEGRIGIGADKHLLGDIALYKRGEGPHFSVGFIHEGTDGYGGEASGSGYFHRSDTLQAALRTETEERELDIDGRYREQETGMQDFADASSLIHRFARAGTGLDFALGEHLLSQIDFRAHYVSRITAGLGGSASYSDPLDEWLLSPSAALRYGTKWGGLRLVGNYDYYQGSGEETFQSIGGFFGFDLFLASLDIASQAGILWDEEEDLLFPFSLRIEGMAGELFHFRLDGGYKTERTTYLDLWERYPFLDAAEGLPLSHGWYTEAAAGGSVGRSFDWGFRSGFEMRENAVSPADLSRRDSADGLFSLRVDDAAMLNAGSTFGYLPVEGLRFSFSWDGEFLKETVIPEGRHRFSAGLDLEEPEGSYGGSFDAAYAVEPTSDLPVLDLGAYYRLSEGVLLRLEWSDMLAPLSEGGRNTWGEYMDPGMLLRIVTEISL